jgi:hypothetical protein
MGSEVVSKVHGEVGGYKKEEKAKGEGWSNYIILIT